MAAEQVGNGRSMGGKAQKKRMLISMWKKVEEVVIKWKIFIIFASLRI